MKYVVIITKQGLIKRVKIEDIRPMGRTAKGVKGITLNEGDEVCCIQIVETEEN